MPRSKRHYKGNNKSDDRKKRRENENSWKSGRGPAEGKSVPKNPKCVNLPFSEINISNEYFYGKV